MKDRRKDLFRRVLWIALAVLGVAGLLAAIWPRQNGEPLQSSLAAAAAAPDLSGFARAYRPIQLSFPADFGPHPEFQTEWWYYTGNLETPDGRHFGYQLTFFRRSLQPPAQAAQRSSDWAAEQVYMAHFSLTDVTGGRYQSFQRLERGAAGLSGAQAAPYQVWLDNWSVEETAPRVYHLKANQDKLSIDLQLTDSKGPVLQGDQGYSRKGSLPGQASYYYSQTRLISQGTIQTEAGRYAVSGLSWMDHEFSTSYLSKDQTGWDWFAIQLDDGSEIMLFHLRKADGSLDPVSSGTLIAPDGSTRALAQADFQISVEATWKSPHTQAAYPGRWTVKIPSAGVSLEIEPYLADQEFRGSYAYWEGAVRIRGSRSGKAVQGSGYVELTGYAGTMGGQF